MKSLRGSWNRINIRSMRMVALILGLTVGESLLAAPTVLKYSFNTVVVDFGDVEVDSYVASAQGYNCQRKRSPTKTTSFSLGVVQGPNPNFPIDYEPLVNGRINHQEFIFTQAERLRLGNNQISLFFTPALLGKREAELTVNIKYDNVLGEQPVKVKLIGRGVCAGYDSDGDLLTDFEETNIWGTDPNSADSDGDGLEDDVEVSLSPGIPYFGLTDPSDPDSDDDGLLDGEEVTKYGTNPLKVDTDDGGIEDGEEVDAKTDPLNGDDDFSPLYALPSSFPSQIDGSLITGTLQPLNRPITKVGSVAPLQP